MAKIVTSALVADIRKKIGGNVFTKGRSGAFVRRKVSPVQPRSQFQRNVRAAFTALSKAWSASPMTDILRAAWNALATNYPLKDKFGASHTLTGLQMFQKINRNMQTIGHAVITTPPPTLEAPSPGNLTVTAAAPSTLTVLADNLIVGTEVAAIFGAAQQSPGRTFVGNKYRLLTTMVFASPTPWDIGAVYTAKFGALIATKKVSILVKYIRPETGAAGMPSAALKVVS